MLVLENKEIETDQYRESNFICSLYKLTVSQGDTLLTCKMGIICL